MKETKIRSTTVIAVRRGGKVAMAGDGQVTMGETVMKSNARKVRKIYDDKVLIGFAGATADAFALFELFEIKLKEYQGDLERAAVELAKAWRMEKALRNLNALLLVADSKKTLLLSGTGDVIEPAEDVIAIGSGGNYAYAAALAYLESFRAPRRRDRYEEPEDSLGNLHLHQRQHHRGGDSRDRRFRYHDSSQDRGGAGPVHRRPGEGQARRGDSAPQQDEAAAAPRGYPRRDSTQEHPHDRADGSRQDGDRPAPGEALPGAVHQGRSDASIPKSATWAATWSP